LNNFIIGGHSATDDAAVDRHPLRRRCNRQQFQVATPRAQAQPCGALDGDLNVATKSGTNFLH